MMKKEDQLLGIHHVTAMTSMQKKTITSLQTF
ncbi:hypothetical protein EB37_01217 [Enterococcus faecalis]|nr:hypothetical protein EB37_01217 [Enterococcus faecalis]